MKFQTIYRFTNQRALTELFDINKLDCMTNFGNILGFDNLLLIADNCNIIPDFFHRMGITNTLYTNKGNSGSLQLAFEIALNHYTDDTVVYFMEDDFLHHPEASKSLILEGLEYADYVSLYDHADKYREGAGNPQVDRWGENTKVFLTESSHWKFTNSTVQTFACKVKTLREDKEILYKYNFSTERPDSYSTFRDLLVVGRKLATPIPGRATHCHSPWESPLIDWKEIWAQTRDSK